MSNKLLQISYKLLKNVFVYMNDYFFYTEKKINFNITLLSRLRTRLNKFRYVNLLNFKILSKIKNELHLMKIYARSLYIIIL